MSAQHRTRTGRLKRLGFDSEAVRVVVRQSLDRMIGPGQAICAFVGCLNNGAFEVLVQDTISPVLPDAVEFEAETLPTDEARPCCGLVDVAIAPRGFLLRSMPMLAPDGDPFASLVMIMDPLDSAGHQLRFLERAARALNQQLFTSSSRVEGMGSFDSPAFWTSGVLPSLRPDAESEAPASLVLVRVERFTDLVRFIGITNAMYWLGRLGFFVREVYCRETDRVARIHSLGYGVCAACSGVDDDAERAARLGAMITRMMASSETADRPSIRVTIAIEHFEDGAQLAAVGHPRYFLRLTQLAGMASGDDRVRVIRRDYQS